MAIEDRLQIKYNQVCSKYQGYFTKPVYKFVRQLVFGILKARHVHLSMIARSLNEPITLKKTWERLSRQLGRPGLAAETTAAHLRENRRAFRSAAYWVVDLTDISKAYAKAMESLAGVWDGSRGERGEGYWVVNAAGVSPKDGSISLMYSELYSLEHEAEKSESENSKILSAVAQLREHLGVARTAVLDRGGDRRVILENFVRNKQPFIIRQRGDRHVFNGREFLSVSEAAARIGCVYKKTVMKIRKGKRRLIRFNGGAMRVYLPKEHGGMFAEALWLVRLTRRDGEAESWYLCSIGAEDAGQAFETAVEGYGCRWKIEEVHRQIKTDYHLESVQLQRYCALKNFNALFWTAMNFIYRDLDGLTVELIESCVEKLSYKPSIHDITGFCYYKLSRAVQLIFSRFRLNDLSRHYPPQAAVGQLGLAFT
jgi:hypothetical protein